MMVLARVLAVLVFASFLAACSGGGSTGCDRNSNPDCGLVNQLLPPSSSASTTVGAGSTKITLPTIATGYSLSLTLPPAVSGAGATINATLSQIPPSGVLPASATYDPLVYVSLSVSQPVTFNGSFTVTVSSNSANGTYYLAFYDGSAWRYDFSGPFTATSNTVTFTGTTNGSLTLLPGITYVIALTTK